METEPKTCAYCNEPISADDPAFITKWFPNKQKLLPVHEFHLRINRKKPLAKPEPKEGSVEEWWQYYSKNNDIDLGGDE